MVDFERDNPVIFLIAWIDRTELVGMTWEWLKRVRSI
jgi:hypothetical protein